MNGSIISRKIKTYIYRSENDNNKTMGKNYMAYSIGNLVYMVIPNGDNNEN